MAIEVVDRSGGETLSALPHTLRILEGGSHTGHRIGLVETALRPRTGGPPEYAHRQHDETFFVVSGSPTFTSGGDTITAQPGTLVTVPTGTPHSFANPGEQPAVILWTVTPDLYIDYFRDLANLRPGRAASIPTRSPGSWPDTPRRSCGRRLRERSRRASQPGGHACANLCENALRTWPRTSCEDR